MTDDEKLIAAAKASLDEAANLALPSDDPVRGVAHDAKKHIARIEKAVHQERRANEAMREAIVTYGRRMTVLMRGGIAFCLVAVAVGAFLLLQLHVQAEQQREGRRIGIRVTCAFAGGVSDAGKKILSRAADTPAERARARVAGGIYADDIARYVEREAGVPVRGLVIRRGPSAGTLDCDRLIQASLNPEP